MWVMTRVAPVILGPRVNKRDAVLVAAYNHQRDQRLGGLQVGTPQLLLREAYHLNLNDGLVVVCAAGATDNSDGSQLRYAHVTARFPRVRLTHYEVGGIVLVEHSQAASPATLGGVQDARPRRRQVYAITEVRDKQALNNVVASLVNPLS